MIEATMSNNPTNSFKALLIKRLPFLLVIAVSIVLVDQWTKFLAIKHLTHSFSEQSDWRRFVDGGHPVPRSGGSTVVDGLWSFQYVENPGAAWGLLSGTNESFRAPFFVIVSIIASVLILNYYVRSPEQLGIRRWALALVFGGALGNFIDRIRLSYVIDFIDWHFQDKWHWPTFNVADAAISIGVVLLLIESFVYKEKPDPKKA
jgi:signal peptidase II